MSEFNRSKWPEGTQDPIQDLLGACSVHVKGALAPSNPEEPLGQELLKAQEQIAKLERMNQNLAKSAQRAEQLLKRHEVMLALVHQFSADLVFRLGKDGRFRFVSPAASALLGFASEQLDGRPFTDLIPNAERSQLRELLQEIMRAEKTESLRLRLKGAKGDLVEVDCHFHPVPHPQTQSPELLGLVRAINPSRAAPAEASIGELGARLAHELSQPLTAIGTTSRICARRLKEELGPEHEITQALEQMAEESERANEMIRRLRQLSVGAPPTRCSLDLNRLVEDTLAGLASPIRQAKVTVAIDLDSRLSFVQADPIQLGQVLLNLIRNALEAMAEVPPAERQLTLRTRRGEGEAEVSISDTGPGIASGVVDKLFQPYHTSKPHGMGLGLALCRSILQAHQGRLWVKGNTPRGAIFFFALPLNS